MQEQEIPRLRSTVTIVERQTNGLLFCLLLFFHCVAMESAAAPTNPKKSRRRSLKATARSSSGVGRPLYTTVQAGFTGSVSVVSDVPRIPFGRVAPLTRVPAPAKPVHLLGGSLVLWQKHRTQEERSTGRSGV